MAEFMGHHEDHIKSYEMAKKDQIRKLSYSHKTKLIVSTCAIERFEDEIDQKLWLKEMLGYLFGI